MGEKAELTAEEIYNYLRHVEIVSLMNNEAKGDVSKYSVFSFGTAASADFTIDEEDKYVVNVDFSSQVRRYPSEQKRLDYNIDYKSVDFEAVKEILMNKYGIEFGLSYDEKVNTETVWNGSGDMETSYDMTNYNIDSHMIVRGRTKDKEFAKEANAFGK